MYYVSSISIKATFRAFYELHLFICLPMYLVCLQNITQLHIKVPNLISYFDEMSNGAKLAVASVARATLLFLPRPEIIYINVLHYSAPPRTYLLRATLPLYPVWRHWR